MGHKKNRGFQNAGSKNLKKLPKGRLKILEKNPERNAHSEYLTFLKNYDIIIIMKEKVF